MWYLDLIFLLVELVVLKWRRLIKCYHCVQVMAYPRQGYSAPIAALDEYNHPTAGVFRVRDVGTKMHVSCMLLNLPYMGILHTFHSTLYGYASHLPRYLIWAYSTLAILPYMGYSMLTALPYLAQYTLLHYLSWPWLLVDTHLRTWPKLVETLCCMDVCIIME